MEFSSRPRSLFNRVRTVSPNGDSIFPIIDQDAENVNAAWSARVRVENGWPAAVGTIFAGRERRRLQAGARRKSAYADLAAVTSKNRHGKALTTSRGKRLGDRTLPREDPRPQTTSARRGAFAMTSYWSFIREIL